MLGIYKVTKGQFFNGWIGGWCMIIDCLFGILTLQFYFCDLSSWWYEGSFKIGKDAPLGLRKRIMYWLVDWIFLFEELIPILTLGRFATSWGLDFATWRYEC